MLIVASLLHSDKHFVWYQVFVYLIWLKEQFVVKNNPSSAKDFTKCAPKPPSELQALANLLMVTRYSCIKHKGHYKYDLKLYISPII